MSKTIQIIINPSELGAGTRGASLGPFAIQAAARSIDNTLFKDFQWEVLPDFNHLLDRSIIYPLAKRIDGMLDVYDAVAESVEKSILNNRFPLLISGDHASAGGTLHGLKNSFPEARIGVVWIDAHADLHSPYTTPSGNLHGMPLATALGVDNLHAQRNHVDIETSLKWNQLKSNSLKFQDLVYVAVRSTEPEEDAVIEAENIVNFTVSSVRKTGVQAILSQIFSQLQNCDFIYVSFDVDSMDPIETSYGTGTPVADGLSVSEARQLLIGLCSSSKLAALEFVEVNPTLEDKKNRMAEVALDLITHCTRTLVESWK